MRYGVLATVGWRAQALEITAEHLAAQTSPLDALLLFYDGPCPMSVEVEQHLGRLADTVIVQMSPTCSGGAWERIRRAAALFGDTGDLFVFDDDMRYPPDYVKAMALEMELLHESGDGGPIGLGGADDTGHHHPYATRAPPRSIAIELELGTSVVPLRLLDRLATTSVVHEMLDDGGWATEAVLGWWWWLHDARSWLVPGPERRPSPVLLPVGGAKDPRALCLASGKHRRLDTWRRLNALTGWPSAVLKGRARTKLLASP
jgi:hypothetical protein